MPQDKKERLHLEQRSVGAPHRAKMLKEVEALVKRELRGAERQRHDFFSPDFSSATAYRKTLAAYRRRFLEMLGWPLAPRPDNLPPATAQARRVGEDSLGSIHRLHVRTLPGVETYGILFLPKGKGPFPLVISQHGGMGTPELCSGLFGDSANYNDMTRRVLRRGVAVFAPQLQLWHHDSGDGPPNRREEINRSLTQLGGSIAALEIFRLTRCLDYLCGRRDIDPGRVGMIGLSYGGFYTLFTAAADLRIKAALSSCFFNDRSVYNWHDWSWKNSARTFFDAEVAGLVCPRPFWVEIGVKDTLFNHKAARRDARRAASFYQRLGLKDNFRFVEFEGGHELCPSDDGIDFLCAHLESSN